MAVNGRPVLALIPARGGSKGVLRKNLRQVAGAPLLHYTLRAGLEAIAVDEVYLSSDDPGILALGGDYGVSLIKRPAELASDTASAVDVVRHFLDALGRDLLAQDPYVVYLQPTSPLRTARHIDDALNLLAEKSMNTLVSIVEMSKSPYKSFQIAADGRLQSLFDERLSNARRQDLPRAFLPNGAIYVFRVSDFLDRGGFPTNGSLPYVMSEESSLDIDSEKDIERLQEILGGAHG